MLTTVNEMVNQPTATVLVNGLSLFNHNQAENSVDFGFLKAISDRHPFRLKIYTVGGLFWSSDEQPPGLLERAKIIIRKTAPSGVYCYRHPVSRDHDPRDYGWLINLRTELYDGKPINFITPPPNPAPFIAKLSIKDATFYNKLKSDRLAEIRERNSSSLKVNRLVGRVVAADMLCQPGENIVVEIWGSNETEPRIDPPLTLLGNQGPYWISFDYKCEPSDANDFPYIYGAIIKPDAREYNLRYVESEVDWTYRGTIGNRYSKECIDECEITEPDGRPDGRFPHGKRVYFNSELEARNAGYEPVTHRVTEYACQAFDTGGSGGIPSP